MSKAFIAIENKNGKAVKICEVRGTADDSFYGSLVEKARLQRKADEKAEEEANETSKAKQAEELSKASRTAYYAVWHYVLACDSLLLDYSLGNDIDSSTAEEIRDSKENALKQASCEGLLETNEVVKERFVALFGEGL